MGFSAFLWFKVNVFYTFCPVEHVWLLLFYPKSEDAHWILVQTFLHLSVRLFIRHVPRSGHLQLLLRFHSSFLGSLCCIVALISFKVFSLLPVVLVLISGCWIYICPFLPSIKNPLVSAYTSFAYFLSLFLWVIFLVSLWYRCPWTNWTWIYSRDHILRPSNSPY